MLDGFDADQIAEAHRTHRSTVFRWLARYRHAAEEGLLRKPGSCRPRKLEDLSENGLERVVLRPASYFGYETALWTAGPLQAAIQQQYRIKVSKDTLWRRLREAGLTYQKSEHQYHEMHEQVRQEWVRKDVPKIRKTVKKHRAILYFQNESNVSLTAFLGKTWAPRARTPKIKVAGKRGGVAAMSAITNRGYLLFRLHEKRIKSTEVIDFLRQTLEQHKRRHLVVAMDQAPPHVSKKTRGYIEQQQRLHVFHLPTYAPDWNPDEKVWNPLKHQELKRRQAKTKPEIKGLAKRKLNAMSKAPKLIRGLFFRCCVANFFG